MAKQTQNTVIALFLLALVGAAGSADAQVDQQRAQEFFKEVQALCERDGGRLWGVSVCGPMIIADIRTQTFATSEPPPAEPRPRAVGFANAPVKWGGRNLGRLHVGRRGLRYAAPPPGSNAARIVSWCATAAWAGRAV